MSKVNRIKEWLKLQMKNKKFVTTTIVFLVLLVAVVFGLTISFSGILGSAYDVDSIEKNIDKIKVGDSINYTVNGYSDWKVLSIDKKNKTMEIISRIPTEDLEIKYSEADNYLDILQNTANKYLDGKYAIGARGIYADQIELDMVEQLGFWINKKEENKLYHDSGFVEISDEATFGGNFLPVVRIKVEDTSNLSVNDRYNYDLNGVTDWTILYVDDSTSISIVPDWAVSFNYKYSGLPNFTSYIESEVAKFKDDDVLEVRPFSGKDVGILDWNRMCGDAFSGKIYNIESEDNTSNGIKEIIEHYSLEQLDICGSNVWSNELSFKKSAVNGFVPVVTLRYGQPSIKDVDKELKVGDYVKYSANAYDSWKVLDINNEKNTVEIVSTTGVKEITLKGKVDYDNYENILQDQVNKYKNGDIVVGARALTTNDIDTLKFIDVPLVKKNRLVFLSEKQQYISEENSHIIYGVTTVNLFSDTLADASISPLYVEPLNDDGYSMSSMPSGNSSVTGQLFPVVTLNLSEVEKVIEDDITTNNKKPIVQGEAASSNTTVNEENNETNENETVVEDKEDYSDIMNEFSKLTNVISNLENDLKEEKSRSNILIVFSVLIIGLICFSFVYFARRK